MQRKRNGAVQNVPAKDQQFMAVKRPNGVSVFMPIAQNPDLYVSDSQNKLRLQSIDVTSDISTMFQSQKTVSLKLLKTFKRIKSLALRVKVAISSAASILAPTPWWMNKLEVTLNNGRVDQTFTPEFIETRLSLMDPDERNALKQMMGYGSNGRSWFNQSAEEFGSIASGASRVFLLPLPGIMFEGCEGSSFPADIMLNFSTRASGIVISGGGTVTVSEMKFVITEAENDTRESKKRSEALNSLPVMRYYIDCQKFTKVLTSSATSASPLKIQLDSLQNGCLSPGIIVQVRESSSNDDAVGSWVAFQTGRALGGQDARISLLKAGQPVMDVDRTVPPDVAFRNMAAKFIGSDLILKKPMYLLAPGDFKQSVKNAEFSQSWFKFASGENDEIEIIPITTAVVGNYVETVTLSGTAAAGSYTLQYGDVVTESLAYNASTATITAALDALKSVREDNIIITPSATVSAGTSLTFTFTGPNPKPRSLVKVIPHASLLTAGSAVVTASSHVWTTTPTDSQNPGGLTATSAYMIDVFVFYYKYLYQNGNDIKVDYERDV